MRAVEWAWILLVVGMAIGWFYGDFGSQPMMYTDYATGRHLPIVIKP